MICRLRAPRSESLGLHFFQNFNIRRVFIIQCSKWDGFCETDVDVLFFLCFSRSLLPSDSGFAVTQQAVHHRPHYGGTLLDLYRAEYRYMAPQYSHSARRRI